jgi:hypothetical protein
MRFYLQETQHYTKMLQCFPPTVFQQILESGLEKPRTEGLPPRWNHGTGQPKAIGSTLFKACTGQSSRDLFERIGSPLANRNIQSGDLVSLAKRPDRFIFPHFTESHFLQDCGCFYNDSLDFLGSLFQPRRLTWFLLSHYGRFARCSERGFIVLSIYRSSLTRLACWLQWNCHICCFAITVIRIFRRPILMIQFDVKGASDVNWW